MDKITPEKRSWNMSRIKSKDTTPERLVRSILHRNGFRYRLHVKEMPGKPDIVMPKYKTIIEVRGCFWHKHTNCRDGRIPETRYEWWESKLNTNSERDKKNVQTLLGLHWNVLIVWQCFLKHATSAEHIKNTIISAIQFCSHQTETAAYEITTTGELLRQGGYTR